MNVEVKMLKFGRVSLQFETVKSISDSPEVKAEHLSCLKHLSSLMRNSSTNGTRTFRGATLQNLEDEIKYVESEISPYRKRKS